MEAARTSETLVNFYHGSTTQKTAISVVIREKNSTDRLILVCLLQGICIVKQKDI
jgi:hypothetical protein